MANIQNIIETLRIKIRRKYMEKTAVIRRKQLKVDNFSIISNNCWGGFIYQSYHLPYNSPTIGLFIMPKDYIKLISNLKYYLQKDIEFILHTNSKYYDELSSIKKFGEYPIGKIQDIEIHFLHYKSEQDAKYKWDRRCKRINYKHLIYKFNDQNGCTFEDVVNFKELQLKNKVFFGSKWSFDEGDFINISSQRSNDGGILASHEPFGNSRKFNVTKFINKSNKG